MIKTAYIFYAEIVREIITARRYLFESVSGLIMMYILFMGFFFASQGFGGSPSPDGGADSTGMAHRTVGFILWLFALSAVGHFGNAIRDDSHIGILEQIAMSPTGMVVDMCGRALGKTLLDCVTVGLVLASILLTTNVSLSFSFFPVIFILFLTLLGLYGLGFFFGGLSLIYKRLGAITIIVRFAFLILTGAITSLSNFPPFLQLIAQTLPMTQGLAILRLLMVEDRSFFSVVQGGNFSILILNSAIYLTIGIVSFKYFEKKAREKGLLGVY